MKIQYHCSPTGQYLLFPPPLVIFKKESRLWRKFLRFHCRHPHIYDYFKRRVIEKLNNSEKISSRMAFELIRWDPNNRLSNEYYSLSNDLAPYYTRTFLEEFPEYMDQFELRPITE